MLVVAAFATCDFEASFVHHMSASSMQGSDEVDGGQIREVQLFGPDKDTWLWCMLIPTLLSSPSLFICDERGCFGPERPSRSEALPW